MKRDMDLIRLLLVQVEDVEKPDLSDYTEDQQNYHKALLVEAGLVHGAISGSDNDQIPRAFMFRPTWEGHEFLDAARNEGVWKKVREATLKYGPLTLPLVKAIMTKYAKEHLGLDIK